MGVDLLSLTQEDYQALSLCTLSETELLKVLGSLQSGFTFNRDKELERYAHEEKWASAYLQFYTPTNIPKLHFLLQRLPKEVLTAWENAHFIDFGSGPGTYTASWLSFFDNAQGSFAVVDKGQAMRDQAKKFLTNLYPDKSFSFSTSIPTEFLNDPQSILFFGHVLNEMSWAEVQKIVEKFKGQAILWVEPGTSQAFEITHKLRSFLLETNQFEVLYPCLGQGPECPAARRKGEWCHQVLRLTWPEWIERTAQKLKIDRRTMPLIAHAYQRGFESQQSQNEPLAEIKVEDVRLARIVRLKKETKHSFEWEVCLEVGNQLSWQKVSVMKRGLSKKEVKKLSNLHTGEKAEFEFVKLLEDEVWRVRLLNLVDPSP